MKSKKGSLSVMLIVSVLAYFFLMFLFFSFFPEQSALDQYSIDGGPIDASGSTYNETATTSTVTGAVISTLSFDIEGITPWQRVVGVIFPVLLLAIGIYGYFFRGV